MHGGIVSLRTLYSDFEFPGRPPNITPSLQPWLMFITASHHELRFPPGLAVPDARHWRVMELHIHLPWFLLSALTKYPGDGTTFVRSYLFAWEADLIEFLSTFDAKRVVGLACMVPGWKSATGNWTSQEVREVWSVSSEDGSTYLELKGVDGERLDVGLPSEAQPPEAARTRLLKISRRRPRTGAKSRSRTAQVEEQL